MPDQEINLKITSDATQVVQEMANARAAVQNSTSGMSSAIASFKSSFEGAVKSLLGFRGALLALGGATAFGVFIKKSIDAADELSKMAQKVGMSTEQLSTLKYAAKLADVSLESLGIGMVRLSKNAAEVANGSGEAKGAFAALGISVKNAEGNLKTSDELLKEIATQFKNLPDGAEKTALAVKLFGRSGAELIPLLNAGAAGIEKLQARAKALGLELSTEAGRAAEEFNDQLKDLKEQTVGLGMSIAQKVLPWLTEWVRTIRVAKEESGFLMAAWVALGGIGLGIGEAAFGTPLQKRIEETKNKVKELEKSLVGGTTEGSLLDFLVNGNVISKIEGVKKELAALEAQQAQIDKSRTDAYKNRSAQEAAEAATKEKNAAIIRAAMESQAKQEEINKQIKTLKEQAATYGMTSEQIELYKLKTEGASASQLKLASSLVQSIAAQKKQKEAMDEGKKVFEDVQTPLEKYNAQLERLESLLDAGAVDFDTFSRAIKKAQDDLDKAEDDKFKELKQTIEGWGKDSAKAIVDFALTGKTSFSDMIQSMISDMMNMLVYQTMMKPLFDSLSKKAGGWASSAGNWLSGLFSGGSSGGGVSYDAPGVTGGWAKGGVFSHGNVIPFARGGIVTRPTIFPTAHGMGIMGEGSRPEGVLPLERLSGGDLGVRAIGGGAPVINIINNNGSEITTNQKETSQGVQIDVLIDQAVAKKLGQFGSNSNRMMRQNFGVREALVKR